MSTVEMLRTKILPMFPPAFNKWFLKTFSELAAWFRARVAYAHTTAVWCMVGHIVGLGYRHGENILFDSTTCDCFHVDFSYLFDKRLQLGKPEFGAFQANTGCSSIVKFFLIIFYLLEHLQMWICLPLFYSMVFVSDILAPF